jgi:glycosyltransferase involved in cell wall biosynthesis
MIAKRPHIAIAVPFSVFPPSNIVSRRLFHLYRHLAEEFNIEIVSLAGAGEPYFKGIIAPNFIETRIPKSEKHQQAEIEMVQELGANVADATLMKLYKLSPRYLSALKKAAKNADFIISYQPYLFPAIREVSNKPIWYEATGIESELKKKLLPGNEAGTEFWEAIDELETKCCQTSNLIITASEDLAQDLIDKQHELENKVICVPNGIDTARLDFTTYEQRLDNQEKLGLKDSFLTIFSGTGNPNNADEARAILNIASKLQDMNFLLLGDVGIFFEPRLTPPNVRFIPSMDEKTKSIIISTADVALNPVKKGSDTQSLMLEYFCQGIPVISTRFGVKGLDVEHGKHCFIGDVWRFPELLVACKKENIVNKEKRLENVKKYVTNNFEWSEIAHKFLGQFQPWNLVS